MLNLSIRTANAAFDDGNAGPEVARILREYADKIDGGDLRPAPLIDYNGNRVGEVTITDD